MVSQPNDSSRFSPPDLSDSHLEAVAELNDVEPDEVTDRMLDTYYEDLREMRAER